MNSALHARAHVSRTHLRRSADGFLSIRGKEGLRFARATVAGKRKRCRSQHKRTIRACCSLLKRRRLAKPTLSSLELVSIAFENINQCTTQAAVWKRPRHRLKEVHAFVAHVFDRVQAGQMQQLKQILEDDPPDWVVAFRMWDETGERVQDKMPSLTTVSYVWHILVSKLSFSWGWFDNHRLPGTFDLVCPRVPIVSTSADHVFHSLRRHPLLERICELKRFMLNIATQLPVDLRCVDGADANI